MVSPHVGGLVTAAIETAAACRELGIESTIVTTDAKHPPQGPERGRIAIDSLPAEWRAAGEIVAYPARHPYRLANSRGMRAKMGSHVAAADVVHIHSLFLLPQFYAFRASRASGTPFIVSLHGALDPYTRTRGVIRKRAVSLLWGDAMLRSAGVIHVTTEEERLVTADVAPEVPREVIPVGVHTASFAGGDGADFRRRHLGGWEGSIVLFLGRITEKKKIDLLLRGFALADPQETMLVVAGPDSGHLEGGFRALAEDLGIGSKVVFPGPLYGSDRVDALAAAQAWALTSATENFGIAVVEAVAAGLPVLVSEEVNLARWVKRHRLGSVCSLDAAGIAAGLSDLLNSLAPEREGSVRRREQALAEVDWGAVAPAYVNMYRQVSLTR